MKSNFSLFLFCFFSWFYIFPSCRIAFPTALYLPTVETQATSSAYLTKLCKLTVFTSTSAFTLYTVISILIVLTAIVLMVYIHYKNVFEYDVCICYFQDSLCSSVLSFYVHKYPFQHKVHSNTYSFRVHKFSFLVLLYYSNL